MGNARRFRRSVQAAQAAALVDTHAQGTGAKNVYTCRRQECGHKIVTVDKDKGVTPSGIACMKDDCDDRMVSGWYPADITLPVTHVWFRPSPRMKAKLKPAVRDHVNKGGLLLRPIEPGETYG